MQLRNTVLALAAAATLVAAAPTAASAAPAGIQTYVNTRGQNTNGPWARRYPLATPVDFSLTLLNEGASSTTFTFSDPLDAVDFWVADAFGSYVAWVPAKGSSPLVLAAQGGSAEFTATWDQTDWWGQALPAGIYSLEATVNSQRPFDSAKIYFEIGDVVTSARWFWSTVHLSKRTARPGERVWISLEVENLTSQVRTIRFGGQWLKDKVGLTVVDASGTEVFAWHPITPMMMTVPTSDYIEAYDSHTYGPIVWPTVDDQGKSLRAGRYTMKLVSHGDPVAATYSRTVTLAGTAVKQGTITPPAGTDTTDVRAGGSASSPKIGAAWNGSDCAVLYVGNYWTQVQVEDATTGKPLQGWVRKGHVTVR